MEVIISAGVLVLVVLGVLAGLDAVTGTAGANKARTVAATLAERDQERLRSMRVLDIDKMNLEPYDVKVGNVTYHVESKAAWVTDASGEEVSCGISKDKANYMRITSTVTSPITGDAVKPVVISSIMAPQVGASATGSLAVMVKGAKGQPIPGVTVTAPPATEAEVTNAAGCAVFGALTGGTYKVTLAKARHVDKEGNPNPTNNATVTVGNLSTIEFAYDEAASITLDVKAKPGDGNEPAKSVVAANGELGGGMRVFFAPQNTSYPIDYVGGDVFYSHTTFVLTNLFPFENGYTFFSGGCTQNDPASAIGTDLGGKKVLAPGENGGNLSVYEGELPIRVRRNTSGTDWQDGIKVWAYPKHEACDGNRILLGTTETIGTEKGKIRYDGLPFGEYTLCAHTGERRATADVNVNSTTSLPATTLNLIDYEPDKVCGDTAVLP